MRLKEKTYIVPDMPEIGRSQPNPAFEASSKEMTQRSLFNIVLKILGIYFVRDVLLALSQTVSTIAYFSDYATPKLAIYNLAMTAGPLLVYTLFSWLLIFQTERLMHFLKLDRSASEQLLPIRLHRSVILSIAVIVIGGITLVNELPELFRQGLYYFQERKIYARMAHPDISYFAMEAVKVFVGLVLIIFNRTIVNLIEKRRKPTTSWYWPLRRPGLKRRKK